MPIAVLIADAQPLFRDALARVVRQRSAFQLVAVAADGRTALADTRRLRPRVALVDVALAELDGPGVLAAIVRDRLPTAVVLLAASVSAQDVYLAIANGAAGCLTKEATADQIGDAIEAVARGGTVLADSAVSGIAEEIRLRERGDRPLLTPREQDVLRRMAAGQTGPAMARELHLALATVKTHMSHLYEKLGVGERAAAVAEGMRRGLLE